MYRLRVTGDSVSSCCSMRSMFSVGTPRIWVSPRSNSAEPWTRGMTSTSADSGRMSVRPRPSMRTLSRRIRCRTTFLVRAEVPGDLLLAALELAGQSGLGLVLERVGGVLALVLAGDLLRLGETVTDEGLH